ncbi:hypothetical protein [Bacillus sp. JCM 19041]|uniref:hypothetical protein n=1 Tax=Bacillus sp. JCM 19041 TaxID=1460637 RepID=UPI000A7A2C20
MNQLKRKLAGASRKSHVIRSLLMEKSLMYTLVLFMKHPLQLLMEKLLGLVIIQKQMKSLM